MNWLRLNNCRGEVIAVDGDSIVLKSSEAPSFGAPSGENPLRLGVFAEEELVGVAIVVGRSGTTLALAESTATIAVGMTLASVPLAEDFAEFQSDIAGKQDILGEGDPGTFLAGDLTWQVPPSADLSGIYTKTEVDSLLTDKLEAADLDGYATTTDLAAKQDVLPASGDPDKYLNGTLEWATPATADLSGYYDKDEVDGLLSGKADTSALSGYATTTALGDGLAGKTDTATTNALNGRVTTAETNISNLQTGKADASTLANYATTTALSNGLATKENSLPGGGSAGDYLRHDKTWGTPPKGLTLIGRWSTPTDAAASTGEMDPRLIASPVNVTPAYVLLSAVANTTGASVQITVGGVNLFSSAVTLAGGTTSPTAFTSFNLPTIPALAAVKPSITAIGGDVRGLVVDVYGREV